MSYRRQYQSGVNWENTPSTSTPINETNLNKMDDALQNIDAEVERAWDELEDELIAAAYGHIDISDIRMAFTDVISSPITYELQFTADVNFNALDKPLIVFKLLNTVTEPTFASGHNITLKVNDLPYYPVFKDNVQQTSDNFTLEHYKLYLFALVESGASYRWDLKIIGDDVAIATTSVAGIVKPDGSTITVAGDGTIASVDQTPVATTSVAGKVKPDGSTITVDANGSISSVGGMPENPLGTAHGGTGNADGYIRTGLASGETAGAAATAEGYATKPTGNYSHAEGYAAWSTGAYSHAEGRDTHAGGDYTHVNGQGVQASYNHQTAVGKFNDNKSTTLFEVGNGTGSSAKSNALEVYANGNVVAGGTITDGSGNSIPALPLSTANGGTGNTAGYIRTGQAANTVVGTGTTIEGIGNTASGNYCHAEGENNQAGSSVNNDHHAHAEGTGNSALGEASHAEGSSNYTIADGSHVEGYNNNISVSAYYAHAEGQGNTVSGTDAHAEGSNNTVSNTSAHAEGDYCIASGQFSHAQNAATTASGKRSSSAGYYVTAGYTNQFCVGTYNNNKSGTLFEIGNGTADNARSNALEVYSNGNLVAGGTISDANGTLNAVTANPSGTASTGLTKLQVGSTIYSISGGDVSGKADKVSGATNGNLAGLDSNGNLTDSGKAASNVVMKSSTSGLLKNDGTVDTNTYSTTQVTANPSGSASTDLTKLKVGSTIYSIPSGGSGSGNTKSKTLYSISSGSWSSSKNSDGFYTYTLTLYPTLSTYYAPTVSIAGSTTSSQPTDTHRRMYGMLERVNLSASNALILYAPIKPTSTFYIFVDGVNA